MVPICLHVAHSYLHHQSISSRRSSLFFPSFSLSLLNPASAHLLICTLLAIVFLRSTVSSQVSNSADVLNGHLKAVLVSWWQVPLFAEHQVCTKIESVVNMNLIDCPFACGTNCTKGSRHPVWDRSRVVCSWDLSFSSIGRLRFQEVAYYTRWRQNLKEKPRKINSVSS